MSQMPEGMLRSFFIRCSNVGLDCGHIIFDYGVVLIKVTYYMKFNPNGHYVIRSFRLKYFQIELKKSPVFGRMRSVIFVEGAELPNDNNAVQSNCDQNDRGNASTVRCYRKTNHLTMYSI